MNSISRWAKAQGGWSHVVAVLAVAATGAFALDKQFHKAALDLWAMLPAVAQDVVTLVVVLAAWYAKTAKKGQTAGDAGDAGAQKDGAK